MTGAAAVSRSKLSSTSSTRWPARSSIEHLERRPGAALDDPDRPGDRARDEHRVVDRLERDEERPVGEVAGRPRAASSIAKRVLPIPPGPVTVSSRAVPSRRRASASSRSRPTNVVTGRSAGCSGRASSVRSGGKSVGSPSMTSWLSRSGSGKSRSRYVPRSRQVDPGRQRLADEPAGRRRDDDLAAVPGGRDPGGAVDVDPDVALVAPGRPRRCGGPSGPGPVRPSGQSAAGQPALAVDRRPDRLGGAREDDEERVALGALLQTAVGLERGPEDRPVAGQQGCRVALGPDLLLEPARALDVAEQEGDRPARARSVLGHRRCRSPVSRVSDDALR